MNSAFLQKFNYHIRSKNKVSDKIQRMILNPLLFAHNCNNIFHAPERGNNDLGIQPRSNQEHFKKTILFYEQATVVHF